jgi:hypothetical protein
MALLQNGFRDFSAGVRLFGLTASNSAVPYVVQGNQYKTGTSRNLTAGEGISSNLAGIPSGYTTQYAWVQPQKAGAIASRNQIFGEGDASASIAGGLNAEASLTGQGDLTGIGDLIISLVASLSGSGDITSAEAKAFLQLAASLSGSGDVAATATAIGHAEAALAGNGDLQGVATALGELAASIVVTGDMLSTANVAAAILDAVNSIEDGVTLRQATRLILAAAAGKISGAGTSTVTIRNAVADDTNRITATVDVDGNRTSITTDLD